MKLLRALRSEAGGRAAFAPAAGRASEGLCDLATRIAALDGDLDTLIGQTEAFLANAVRTFRLQDRAAARAFRSR